LDHEEEATREGVDNKVSCVDVVIREEEATQEEATSEKKD
jgi:hypothetical protein